MKIAETIIGSWRYAKLASSKNKFPNAVRGICLSSLSDQDITSARKFRASMVRVDENQAEEYSIKAPIPFWVVVGLPEDSVFTIADKIVKIHMRTKIKPQFYAIVNEHNGNTYEKVNAIKEEVAALLSGECLEIYKGPTTSCVESAGFEVYQEFFSGKRTFEPEDIHILHFYLHPTSAIINAQRKFLLAYIVTELRKRGVDQILIAEAHDASTTKIGFPDQGDYVYATKEGWEKIEDICKVLGVDCVQYYASSYLNYSGNTVLDH